MQRHDLRLPLLLPFLLGLATAVPASADGPPRSMVRDCEKGDPESCWGVGLNQTSEDPALSRRYYALGCELGHRKSCWELYRAAEEILDDDDAPERAEAIGYLERACAVPHGPSCSELASVLWDGDDGPADRDRAAELWVAGCEDGSRLGCRRAGGVFENGEVVEVDLPRALDLYREGCRRELASACDDAGRLLHANPSLASGPEPAAREVVELSRAACLEIDIDDVEPTSCTRLGRLLAAGEGVSPNPEDAAEAFRIGCQEDGAEACVESGRAAAAGLVGEPDAEMARQRFGKACDLGSDDGCEALCRSECDLGQPWACDRLEARDWPMARSCSMPG